MRENTCPCSEAGLNVVLPSRLSPYPFPPSLPPSLPPSFLPVWTLGSSLGLLETPVQGWLHADSAELPNSGILWEGCPHPRPPMGRSCCICLPSSASIINGAVLGFTIVLSAFYPFITQRLQTSPTRALPSPCQPIAFQNLRALQGHTISKIVTLPHLSCQFPPLLPNPG